MKKIVSHFREHWIQYGFETLVVILGILGAYTLNNWNEQRKENAKMRVYLSHLVEDFKENRRVFDETTDREVFRFYSLQYLYQLTGRQPFEVSEDRQNIPPFSANSIWENPLPGEYDKVFIGHAFIWSTRIGFAINQSTLEEMKSTGSYSLLEDDMKNRINNYYRECQWRLGSESRDVRMMYVEKWRESLMQHGIYKSIPFETTDPIKVLKDDPYMTALILQLIEDSAWTISSAEHLTGLGDSLIVELEKYVTD